MFVVVAKTMISQIDAAPLWSQYLFLANQAIKKKKSQKATRSHTTRGQRKRSYFELKCELAAGLEWSGCRPPGAARGCFAILWSVGETCRDSSIQGWLFLGPSEPIATTALLRGLSGSPAPARWYVIKTKCRIQLSRKVRSSGRRAAAGRMFTSSVWVQLLMAF